MEELQQTPLQETKLQRPGLLTVICILTFVGSGMNVISSLVIFFFFDAFKIVAASLVKSFNIPEMEMLIEGPSIFLLLLP